MSTYFFRILIAFHLTLLSVANAHAANDNHHNNYSAAWQLNPATSSLTFNTTKAGAAGVGGVTETLRFTALKGGLSADGHIEFIVDLASVESGIDLRNERLRSMLWDTAHHPSASFSATLDAKDLKKVREGKESLALSVEGQLMMAGKSKPIRAELQVTPVHDRRIVNTRHPIIVNAEDFGLKPGVEALRQIMALNYLSSSAPVTLQLDLVATPK